jgi:hypothetical protein
VKAKGSAPKKQKPAIAKAVPKKTPTAKEAA